jgi:hypothetical protein
MSNSTGQATGKAQATYSTLRQQIALAWADEKTRKQIVMNAVLVAALTLNAARPRPARPVQPRPKSKAARLARVGGLAVDGLRTAYRPIAGGIDRRVSGRLRRAGLTFAVAAGTILAERVASTWAERQPKLQQLNDKGLAARQPRSSHTAPAGA